jgi:hypothetical protein
MLSPIRPAALPLADEKIPVLVPYHRAIVIRVG